MFSFRSLSVLVLLLLTACISFGQGWVVTQAPVPHQEKPKTSTVCNDGSCSVASSSKQEGLVYLSTSPVYRRAVFSGRRASRFSSGGSCSNGSCR